eukprot:4542516-Prymnesium_polylepis.1
MAQPSHGHACVLAPPESCAAPQVAEGTARSDSQKLQAEGKGGRVGVSGRGGRGREAWAGRFLLVDFGAMQQSELEDLKVSTLGRN